MSGLFEPRAAGLEMDTLSMGMSTDLGRHHARQHDGSHRTDLLGPRPATTRLTGLLPEC
jgi:hypothetical protein